VLGHRFGPERNHRVRVEVWVARLLGRRFLVPALEERRLGVVTRGHPHIAAERQPREDVLRFPAAELEDRWAEPDGKARRVNANGLGGDEMSELVHEDHESEDEHWSENR